MKFAVQVAYLLCISQAGVLWAGDLKIAADPASEAFAAEVLKTICEDRGDRTSHSVESMILDSIGNRTPGEAVYTILKQSAFGKCDANGVITATGFTLYWNGVDDTTKRRFLFTLRVDYDAKSRAQSCFYTVRPSYDQPN